MRDELTAAGGSRSGRAARRRRAALPGLGLAVGLVATAVGLMLLGRGAAPTLDAAATAPAAAVSTTTVPATATPGTRATRPAGSPRAPSADPDVTRVPVVSTTVDERVVDAPAPVLLAYPRFESVLNVVPAGVAADGQMDIPPASARAAWYRYGPAPADRAGDVVLAAHVGSQGRPGPFYHLLQASPGDEMVVSDARGEEHRYRVSSVEQLPKEGLDLDPWFRRAGPERLVVITCGGDFVPGLGQYEDNVIVAAERIA